jgi:hypothetical protein
MGWEVLFDEDFAAWLETLDEGLQDEILAHVELFCASSAPTSAGHGWTRSRGRNSPT